MNLKLFSIVLLFVLFAKFSCCQNVISGRVTDAYDNEPIAFANVVVFSLIDSTILDGVVTDTLGVFSVEKKQNALMSVSYLGYLTLCVEMDSIVGDVDLKLTAKTEMLDEVSVKATKDCFSRSANCIVADVANTKLSMLGSAKEVLLHMPFVVRNGDSFEVMGRGKPLVFIDERQVSDEFEIMQLSAVEIESVELILSPGVEYNSNVGSVIKIQTVSNSLRELDGFIQASASVNKNISTSDRFSLNYAGEKMEVFGSIAFQRQENDIEESWSGESRLFDVGVYSSTKMCGYRLMPRIGFDFKTNAHEFGIMYQYSNVPQSKNLSEKYYYATISDSSVIHNMPDTVDESFEYSYVNAYYKYEKANVFRTKLDLNYSTGNSSDNEKVDYGTNSMWMIQRNNYSIWSGKINTTFLLQEAKELNVGSDFSHTNELQNYNYNGINTEVLRFNDNEKIQDLFSVYSSFTNSMENWRLTAGLRYEYDRFRFCDSLSSRNKVYINGQMTYEGESINALIAYKGYALRPNYEQINNSVKYVNEYCYERGNAYLKTAYYNSLDMTVSGGMFSMSSNASLIKNHIVRIIDKEESLSHIWYDWVNVGKVAKFSLSGNASIEVGFVQFDVSMNFQQQFLKYQGKKYHNPLLMLSISSMATISPSCYFVVDYAGNTRGCEDMTYYKSGNSVNASVMKSFFSKKLRIVVSANDIFKTSRMKYEQYAKNLLVKGVQKMDARNFSVNVTYIFSGRQNRYDGESIGNEIDRVIGE